MSTKTDNFLQAIQRYTEEQKSIANTEVELLKEEKLKKAEENGKRDSERYIQQQLEAKVCRNKQTLLQTCSGKSEKPF